MSPVAERGKATPPAEPLFVSTMFTLPKVLGHMHVAGKEGIVLDKESWHDFLQDLLAMERFAEAEQEPPEALSNWSEVKQRLWGNSIKSVRKAKGTTQIELAERLGCRQSYISKLENPDYRPRPSTIVKVAEALECDPESLI